jgi:hypothetical protein
MADEDNSPAEKSPGGSIIYHHKQLSGARVGFTDESTREFRQARDEAYARLFGEAASVSHEILPLIPHIDVITYYRRGKDGRDVCTLVTGGMSDLAMTLPGGAKAPRRVELISYCGEPKQEYIDTIRWLAHFPHNQKTGIGSGSTIPNGDPPAPFWESPILDTILLLPPVIKRDQTLPNELILGGDPVHFLWLVPVTTRECDLKLAKGVGALLDLFGQNRHPHVFDPNRKSYV